MDDTGMPEQAANSAQVTANTVEDAMTRIGIKRLVNIRIDVFCKALLLFYRNLLSIYNFVFLISRQDMNPINSKQPLSPAEAGLKRLQRMSQFLALTCWVLIFALPPLFTWFWAVATPAQLADRLNLPADIVQGALMVWQRVVGGLISAVPLGLLLAGLWHARKCLGLFATGQVFTLQTAVALRRFASFATASFACSFVAGTALSTLLTINNMPGARIIAVGVSTEQVIALFFAGMVWLMAAVIAQGHQLAEENARFV
jgi:Protein of unknown function (DUF2975)